MSNIIRYGKLQPGSRIRISRASRSLVAPHGALGWVDHEVPCLSKVYGEPCWAIRLDGRGAHLQWESELELIEESK